MRNSFFLALCLALLFAIGECRKGAATRERRAPAGLVATTPGRLPVLTSAAQNKSRKLDIVIAHFHKDTVADTITNWTRFLSTDKVKELEPSVFVYCLNTEIDLGVFDPIIREQGSAVHMINVGREGAVYLAHILNHWDDLAEHTILSQAVADASLSERFRHLFTPKTGVMPLALYAHQECSIDDQWLPQGQVAQLYAILVRRFCPPEGYSAFFNGQMIVSRKRIQTQPKEVYSHLNEMLTAPIFHWIHSVHKDPHYKNSSNPFFGHSLERSWSLVFNCHDLWRFQDCARCDRRGWQMCQPEACQCLDPE